MNGRLEPQRSLGATNPLVSGQPAEAGLHGGEAAYSSRSVAELTYAGEHHYHNDDEKARTMHIRHLLPLLSASFLSAAHRHRRRRRVLAGAGAAGVTVQAWLVLVATSTPFAKAGYRLIEVGADGGWETESLSSP